MNNLCYSDAFLKNLFDALPIITFVVDEEGRVISLNKTTKEILNITDEDAHLKRGGEIFNCIYHSLHPEGCGYHENCKKCTVRLNAMKAIEGQNIHRSKAKLAVFDKNREIHELALLLSAAPVNYKEKRFAIVIIEDVTLITQLVGLLPVCANCNKLRDENGQWEVMENYLRKHSEADFTHTICPECSKKLYPEIS